MHRGIDDWVPPEPSTATLSSKAQGLPQLDPMRVLSHLEDSLDVRDAYIEELGDLAARLAASYAENTATDVSTEASSDFFGCVRGLRECTLVAADLAHFLANRAWNTSRGTLALACLIGPDSAGSRLAKAGHDVLDILQNTEPPTLSDLLDSGHWSLVSSETGLPDPLMAGLTFSGRPMSDQVLSARQKRGIAPSIPTSQVRQLFSQVVYWQGLQTSLEASKEAAAAFERAIAESNDRLAAWKVQKASEEHCSKLESILKEIAAEEENAEDATLRLKDLRREEIELNDRVEYWEEKVLSSQALQSNLTRLRTQTKSHVLSMELAQEQLEEREEELKQKQDEEAELLEVLATLQQGGGKEDQTQNAADTIAATQSEPSVPPKETKPAEGPKETGPIDLPKEPTTEDLMRSAWTAAAAVASLTPDGATESVSVEEMMDVEAAKAKHGPDSLEMGRAAAAAGISSLYLWLKAEGDMANPAVCAAATQLLVESVRMHRAWLGPLHPTVFLLQTYTQAATMLSMKGSDFSVEDAEAEVAAAIKAHGSGSKEAGEMAAAGGLALMLQGHGGEGCELLSKAMDTMIALLGPKSGAAVGIGAAMGGTCTPKAGSRRPMRAAPKAPGPSDLPKEPTTEDLMRSAWTAAAAVASLTPDGASEPMPVSVEEMMDVQAAKAKHGPDSLEMGRAAAAAGISSLYLWLKAEGDMADPAVCTAATQLLVESVRMHRAWLGPLHPTVFLLQTYTQAATMLSMKGSDFSVEDAEAEVAAAIKAHGSGSKEAGEMAAAGGLALMLQGHGGEGCELLSTAMDTMAALLGPKSGAAVGIGAAMGGTCTPKAGSRRPMRAAAKAPGPTDLPKEPTTEDLMRSAWTAAAAVASLTSDGASEPMPVSVEEMMDVQAAKAKHGPDSLEMGRAAAAAGISSLYLWLKAEGDMADPAVCAAATQLLVESVRMHRAWLGPLHPTVFLLQTYTQAATMLSKKGSDFSVEDAEAEVAAAIKAHGSGSKEAGEMAAAGGLALMLQGHGGEGCELLSTAMDTMAALLGPKSGAAVGIGAAMGGTCTPKAGSRRPMRAAPAATAPTDLPKEPSTEDLMRSAWTAAAAVASLTSDGASEPMPVSVEEMMDVQAAKAKHGPDSLEMGRAAAAAGISSLYLWLKAEGDMADPAVCTAATQLLVESVRMHRAWLGPLHPTVFLLQTYTQAATMLSKKGSNFSVGDAEAEVAAAIKAHGSGSKEAGEMAAAGGLALMLQGHGGEGCELLSTAMDTMAALLGPKSGAAVGIGAAMGGTCTPKAGSRRPMRAAPKATGPIDLPKEPTTEDLMRSAWTAAAAVASLTSDGASEPVSVEEMMDVEAAKAKHGPDSLEMGRAAAAAGISSLYLWLKAEGDMADPAVCTAATQLLVESVRMHRVWLGPLHPTVFLLQTYTQAATMLSKKGSDFSVEDAEAEVAAAIKAHGSGSKEAGEMAAAGGLALMLQGHGGEGCELLSKAMDTMAALLGPKSGAAVGIGAAMGGTCTPKAGSRRPMRAAPAATAPTDLPKEPSTEDLMRSAWTAAAAVASLTPDGAAEPMPVSVEEMMDVQAAKAKHGPDSLEMGRAAAAAGISSLYLWLKAEGDMADPDVCAAATQLLVESVRMHRAWLGPLHPTVFLLQTYTQAATMLSKKGSNFSVGDAEAEVAAAIKAHGSGSKEAGEMAAAGGLALMLQGHGGEGCELLSTAMDTMAALLGPKSGAAVGIGAAMGGTCTPKAGSRRPMRAAPKATGPIDLPKEPTTEDLMRSAWTAAAAVASLTSDGASEPVSVEEMMDVEAAKAKHGPDSLEMGRAAAAAGISSLYLWLKAEGDMADPAVCTAATQLLVESVRMHRVWLGPLHPTVFLLQTYTQAATMLSKKGSDFSVEDAEAEVAAAIKAHGSGSKEAGEMAAAGGLALMLQGHGGEGCELLSKAMDTMAALLGPKSGAAVGIGAAMGGTCTPKAGSRRPMRAAPAATAPTDLPKEPSTEDLMRSAWTAAAAVASLTPDGAAEPMPVSVEEMMDVQAAKAKHGPDSLEMGRAAAAAGISSLYLWLKAEGDMADPDVCAAATQLLVESVRMHRAWLGPLHPTVFLLQTYTQAATMLSMKGSNFSVGDAEAEVAAAIKAHGSGSKEAGEMAAAGGLALMLQGHGGEGCELLSKAMDTMIALLGPKSGAAVGIGAAMGGTCTPKAGSRRPMRAAPKAPGPSDLPKEPTTEDLMRSAWTAAAAVASLTPDGATESVSVEEMMDVQAAKAKHGPDSLEMGRAAAAAGISSLYLWLKAEGDMADPAVCTAATQLLVESVRMHRAWLGPLHPTVFLLQTYTMAATMLSKKGGSFSVEDAEAEVAARMPGSKEAGEMAAAGGLALMLQGVGKVGCELLSKAMDTMTALLGPNSGPVVGIVAAMGGTCTP